MSMPTLLAMRCYCLWNAARFISHLSIVSQKHASKTLGPSARFGRRHLWVERLLDAIENLVK